MQNSPHWSNLSGATPCRMQTMGIHATKPLFAWDELEDSPSLKTIKQLLDTIPDDELLVSLNAARGRGRDDFPVRVLWGCVVLAIALRHANAGRLPGRTAAQ